MNTVVSIIKKTTLYSAAFVVAVFSPLIATTSMSVAAEGEAAEVCTPPPNNQNGVHYPVGADAGTYTYQCEGAYAGYWTNAYYKYDPVTTQRFALYSPEYAYDCAAGNWLMTVWDYSPASGTFVKSRIVPDTAPNLATGCPAPAAPTTPSTTGNDSASATTSDSNSGASGNAISNTGPGSSNNTNGNITLNNSTTNNTGITMQNGLTSQAGTGHTFVIGNTTGGSATSGNAQSVANVANVLQSSTNVFGPNTTIFTADINGDVNGDFMFDPNATLSQTGPGSSNNANNNLTVNTKNTNNTDATITNDINVGANSGNATVANNTNGGDATSGNAQAVVNLMNLINSTVSSGKSFVGTININGNLNGDILLPQNLLDQLIASSGPGSSNNANTNITDNSQITNNTTATIDNNIDATASTGNANVSGNTNGGTATSGNAQTNITLLNLTGSNTVGKNNILVFVNVLGKWVGLIMNAPQGSTAASLGGGILNSGPGSSNNTNTAITDNSQLTNNADLTITNNVTAHAQSGNANVTGNTTGGNATSGDAMTAVNVLNMIGSNLNLSDWFGILFINVYGSWIGSFGVNTSAGDPDPTVATQANSNDTGAASTPTPAAPTFAAFIPKVPSAFSGEASGSAGGNSSDVSTAVLAASTTTTPDSKAKVATATPTVDRKSGPDYTIAAVGVTVALLMLAGERIVTLRKSHKA